MPSVAFKDSKIVSKNIPNHIKYQVWNEQKKYVDKFCTMFDNNGNCLSWGGGYYEGGYDDKTGDAELTGVVSSSRNVYVNDKPVAVNGDMVNGDCKPLISGGSNVENHGKQTGKISSGNSKNVYVDGKSVAVIGSSVNIHGQDSKIEDGSKNVFIG